MKVAVVFLLALCYLALSATAWDCVQGPKLHHAHQIDAGSGIVVARNRHFYPYILFGRSWRRICGLKFRHLSVGPAGIWGVGLKRRVWMYKGRGRFRRLLGLRMKQVDAGGKKHIVGVSASNRAYCLRTNSPWRGAARWKDLSKRLRYYSCSPRNGCWGVAKNFKVFHTKNVNSATCGHSDWKWVKGLKFKMIEVGTDGNVFGLTRKGQVYQRRGISRRLPCGRRWVRIPLCFKIRHLTYDRRKIWAVTRSGSVMTCKH